MATRSRTSFQKRQKELARMERQRDKAARRAARRAGTLEPREPDTETPPSGLSGQPDGEAPTVTE